MQGKEASEQETKANVPWESMSAKTGSTCTCFPPTNRCASPTRAKAFESSSAGSCASTSPLVVVEATGKWHRELRRSLGASGIPVAVIDPYRVRMFARAQGIFAKTDRLDAKVLALFAAVMAPPCRPPAPEALENLKELITARDSAVAEQTAVKNQLSAAQELSSNANWTGVSRDWRSILQRSIANASNASRPTSAMARRSRFLTSIPGIGKIVAITLIACLAETGKRSAASKSPPWPGSHPSPTIPAREKVSAISGAAAQSCAECSISPPSAPRDPILPSKPCYHRLTATKPPKVALIALARKLATLANTLICQDRPWEKIAPQMLDCQHRCSPAGISTLWHHPKGRIKAGACLLLIRRYACRLTGQTRKTEGAGAARAYGWFRAVHVKSFDAHRARVLLGARSNWRACWEGCLTTSSECSRSAVCCRVRSVAALFRRASSWWLSAGVLIHGSLGRGKSFRFSATDGFRATARGRTAGIDPDLLHHAASSP